MSSENLNARAIIEILNKFQVEYIVIGAFAAIAQGVPIEATRDIDFTPRNTIENLQSLSDALYELKAKIRVAELPEGLDFSHTGASLGQSTIWNLICEFGEFDLFFNPGAFPNGFDDLLPGSLVADIAGTPARLAALSDIITSKEAAGRPKDLRVLGALTEFLLKRNQGQ
jgi:hypothetical protein